MFSVVMLFAVLTVHLAAPVNGQSQSDNCPKATLIPPFTESAFEGEWFGIITTSTVTIECFSIVVNAIGLQSYNITKKEATPGGKIETDSSSIFANNFSGTAILTESDSDAKAGDEFMLFTAMDTENGYAVYIHCRSNSRDWFIMGIARSSSPPKEIQDEMSAIIKKTTSNEQHIISQENCGPSRQ